eukprot:2814694-Rhodomonas_salina.3
MAVLVTAFASAGKRCPKPRGNGLQVHGETKFKSGAGIMMIVWCARQSVLRARSVLASSEPCTAARCCRLARLAGWAAAGERSWASRRPALSFAAAAAAADLSLGFGGLLLRLRVNGHRVGVRQGHAGLQVVCMCHAQADTRVQQTIIGLRHAMTAQTTRGNEGAAGLGLAAEVELETPRDIISASGARHDGRREADPLVPDRS